MKSSNIGGQAVLEGIMMKNKDRYAVAVRKHDQEIEVDVQEYKSIVPWKAVSKIPFIRGIFSFVDSLVLGMKTLMYSASFFEDEEVDAKELTEEEAEKEEKKEQPAGLPGTSLEGKTVLLAEDNEVNMEIADEILSMNGMQVTRAWNGVEAVEEFRSSKPFSFDAILMDMQMPEMDGCEASRRIRAMRRPDAKSVPIIAVTANAFAEDITATAAAGMNAHVSKPIDFSLLCKLLEKWIHKGGTDGEDKA